MYTTASGVQIPQGTDSFSPTTQFKAWADKAATYENRVIVASDSERTSLAAPVLRDGLECYVTGTDRTWLYEGTTWVAAGANLTARAVRTATSPSPNAASFTNLSLNADWTTSGQGQLDGFTAYNNGWTIPVAGVYEISYELVANQAFLAGVSVNNAAPAATDLIATSSPAAVQGYASAVCKRDYRFSAGQVVRVFGIAAAAGTILRPGVGAFGLRWLSA